MKLNNEKITHRDKKMEQQKIDSPLNTLKNEGSSYNLQNNLSVEQPDQKQISIQHQNMNGL